MKAHVTVRNRKEAKLIRRGLAQKDVRALVMVIGALDVIPDDEVKKAVIEAAVNVLDAKNQAERRKTGHLL